MPLFSRFALLALCALLTACATTEDGFGPRPPGVGSGAGAGGRLTLARTADDVKTVQLFRTGDETSLPVVTMGGGGTLTLGFDVLEDGIGRPLSVYFYHADRTWRRDLVPSEYLRSFLSDNVRDYLTSSATGVDYVHYSYEFPNSNIDFLVSGNYIVRVAEQGNEREVLLERAFFVSEDAAEIELGFQSGFSNGSVVVQPVVQLRPTAALQNAQPFDYAVCFARNARFIQTRCTEDPNLLDLALFQFYLSREQSFPAERPYYEVDLGPLQIGPDVAGIDYGTDPYTALLELDYQRFGSQINNASLTGQPVVRSVFLGGGRADVQAEYVTTRFRYVPVGEREAPGPVLLSGAFNGWQLDPALAMTWNPETARYEGELLLKQGLYLYQYVIEDPDDQQGRGLSLQPSLYTAFAYVRDPIRSTDRLVAYRSRITQ